MSEKSGIYFKDINNRKEKLEDIGRKLYIKKIVDNPDKAKALDFLIAFFEKHSALIDDEDKE